MEKKIILEIVVEEELIEGLLKNFKILENMSGGKLKIINEGGNNWFLMK
jgi:hypothetical protein